MNFERHAIILSIVEQLNRLGGSSGKTHVQKSLFLVQAVHRDLIPFQYVLYKHGPYSFEVEDELEEMKSYAAIASRPVLDYGVAFAPDAMAEFVRKKAPLTGILPRRLETVCQFVSGKCAADLERISTAAWVYGREGIEAKGPNVERIVELKPHVSRHLAEDAFDQWHCFRQLIEAEEMRAS